MCHVLIIEDEPLIAMSIEAALEDEGVDSIHIAATEDQAIKLARSRKPNLITSDVKLAKGSGPAAVAQILRDIGPVPVIFITATPEDCSENSGVVRGQPKPASNMTKAATNPAVARLTLPSVAQAT